MSIPAFYTYETFANYLKNEVLLDTVEELGWNDYYSAEEIALIQDNAEEFDIVRKQYLPTNWIFNINSYNFTRSEGIIWIDPSSSTGTTRDLLIPSEYDIPAGTIISFPDFDLAPNNVPNGTNNFIVASDVDKGDTAITFTTSHTANEVATTTGFFYNQWVAPDLPEGQTFPIFTAITDSVLQRLGKSSIESITSLNEKKKLRLFGRRECWYFGMQSVAADYDYATDMGSIKRFDLYRHCKEMYQYESDRISRLYGAQVEGTGQLVTTTERTKVKVRW